MVESLYLPLGNKRNNYSLMVVITVKKAAGVTVDTAVTTQVCSQVYWLISIFPKASLKNTRQYSSAELIRQMVLAQKTVPNVLQKWNKSLPNFKKLYFPLQPQYCQICNHYKVTKQHREINIQITNTYLFFKGQLLKLFRLIYKYVAIVLQSTIFLLIYLVSLLTLTLIQPCHNKFGIYILINTW